MRLAHGIVALAGALSLAAGGQDRRPTTDREPWVVIDQPRPERYDVLTLPHILARSDGSYVASAEHLGHHGPQLGTYVYRTRDQGRSWSRVATLDSPRRASFFELEGALYLLGVDGSGRSENGHPLIRRSTDGGETWSLPSDPSTGLLGADNRLESGAAPVVIQAGRIWLPFFRREFDGSKLGLHVQVTSASVGADLLQSGSWSWSEELPLDGMGHLWSAFLLRDELPTPTLFARSSDGSARIVADLSSDGRRLSPRAQSTMRPPTSALHAGLSRDGVSGKAFVLTKADWTESEGGLREIVLTASTDLVTWEMQSALLRDRRPKPEGVVFGRAEFTVAGDDLLAVLCARLPVEHELREPTQDWALLFLRVPKFRHRTLEDPPLWDAR